MVSYEKSESTSHLGSGLSLLVGGDDPPGSIYFPPYPISFGFSRQRERIKEKLKNWDSNFNYYDMKFCVYGIYVDAYGKILIKTEMDKRDQNLPYFYKFTGGLSDEYAFSRLNYRKILEHLLDHFKYSDKEKDAIFIRERKLEKAITIAPERLLIMKFLEDTGHYPFEWRFGSVIPQNDEDVGKLCWEIYFVVTKIIGPDSLFQGNFRILDTLIPMDIKSSDPYFVESKMMYPEDSIHLLLSGNRWGFKKSLNIIRNFYPAFSYVFPINGNKMDY